jgi:hypothetical protein
MRVPPNHPYVIHDLALKPMVTRGSTILNHQMALEMALELSADFQGMFDKVKVMAFATLVTSWEACSDQTKR